MMRLRVGEILKERQWTAYRLAKESGGRIGLRQAYRLAQPTFGEISAEMIEALCDTLDLEPGPLFARE